MSYRAVYLAKFGPAHQRRHFGVFIPNEGYNSSTLRETFQTETCIGTLIHVVGEPMIVGFTQEFKRNFNCTESRDLNDLVPLGVVLDTYIYEPSSTKRVKESTPRCQVENIAMQVLPPPGGQDVRVPIDGVTTKRCQEWTMEFLGAVVEYGLIHESAIGIAQAERDPATHGIFGQNNRRRR